MSVGYHLLYGNEYFVYLFNILNLDITTTILTDIYCDYFGIKFVDEVFTYIMNTSNEFSVLLSPQISIINFLKKNFCLVSI